MRYTNRHFTYLLTYFTLVNPHQAGAAYVTLASAVDWNTVCRAGGGMPWLRRVRSPYRARPQLILSMWLVETHYLTIYETLPSAFSVFRSKLKSHMSAD